MFLVSSDIIEQEWRELATSCTDDYEIAARIARNHKVTFMVVARQALDSGLLSKDDFFSLYRRHRIITEEQLCKQKKRTEGGNPYDPKRYRLGTVFSEAVWSALNSDMISLNDAYDLAGLTSKSFDEYYRRLLQ